MKNLQRTLAFATCISISLFLTACGSADKPEVKDSNDVDPSTTQSSDTTADVITEQDILNEGDLVLKYFKENNLEACDTLKLANLKKQCTYNIIVSRATKNSDPSICEDLTDPIQIDNCKTSAENTK